MRALWLCLLVSTTPLAAESTPDPLAALRFFEGDWEATVYAGGKAVKVRETITRTQEGFTAVWEQQQPDGTWAAYSRERFTRAAQNKK